MRGEDTKIIPGLNDLSDKLRHHPNQKAALSTLTPYRSAELA